MEFNGNCNDLRIKVSRLRERLRQLRPEDCPYCGAWHRIRVSRSGYPLPDAGCCDDMIREVMRLEREIFGERP